MPMPISLALVVGLASLYSSQVQYQPSNVLDTVVILACKYQGPMQPFKRSLDQPLSQLQMRVAVSVLQQGDIGNNTKLSFHQVLPILLWPKRRVQYQPSRATRQKNSHCNLVTWLDHASDCRFVIFESGINLPSKQCVGKGSQRRFQRAYTKFQS